MELLSQSCDDSAASSPLKPARAGVRPLSKRRCIAFLLVWSRTVDLLDVCVCVRDRRVQKGNKDEVEVSGDDDTDGNDEDEDTFCRK